MFRRKDSSLPKDPEFPADLEGLGYCVNSEDQIRAIDNPDQEFHYFFSKNERYVEKQREAMNTCIRQNVMERLLSSSMTLIRLPLSTPALEPHVPILASANLPTASRIIICVGEAHQDLGIFAYRIVGAETVAAGSAINFVNAAHSSSPDPPAVILANIGQLIWHRRSKQPMTMQSWLALPRKTGVDPPMSLNSVKNRVPQNEDFQAHLKCVFEDVVGKMARKDAKIDVVGISSGAAEVVEYLQTHWKKWQGRTSGVAVVDSYAWNMGFKDENFRKFWEKNARAYLLSEEILGCPVEGQEMFGCCCFSAGDAAHIECVMPRAYREVLRYLELVAGQPNVE